MGSRRWQRPCGAGTWCWRFALRGFGCCRFRARPRWRQRPGSRCCCLFPPQRRCRSGRRGLPCSMSGQGTAVLVQTETRALLYDAGPSYLSGRDAGASVVVPALKRMGVRELDMLVASHGDTDHAGGVASVLRALPAGTVLAGEPVPDLPAATCRAGLTWEWDGVRFTVLHPPSAHAAPMVPHDHEAPNSNDSSCVLLIETRNANALLPGDIEQASSGCWKCRRSTSCWWHTTAAPPQPPRPSSPLPSPASR